MANAGPDTNKAQVRELPYLGNRTQLISSSSSRMRSSRVWMASTRYLESELISISYEDQLTVKGD